MPRGRARRTRGRGGDPRRLLAAFSATQPTVWDIASSGCLRSRRTRLPDQIEYMIGSRLPLQAALRCSE
jgi:hypothetical protein